MTDIKTQLTANFGAGTGAGAGPLAIEGDPGFYTDDAIHLLLFSPTGSAVVRASTGTVSLGSVVPAPVPGGIITFNGGDSASLPKAPYYSGTAFEVLFAFTPEGALTTIAVSYDPVTFSVRANKACYAAVAYTPYVARATRMSYRPSIDVSGSGSVGNYGVIAAYVPPSSIITYQVQPARSDGNSDEIEVYRMVSYSVTNAEGEWELPPGYPSNGTYPGKSEVMDVSGSMKAQRVHEIGLLGMGGRTGIRTYHVPKLKPYTNDASYVIKPECIPSQLPLGATPADIARAAAFAVSRNKGCKK